MAYLKVEVVTQDCDDGECYVHTVKIPEETSQSALDISHKILDAIFTLYALKEIISYSVMAAEEEDNGSG